MQTGASAGREQWGSRFGFIMAAAGSAVGLGNIWGFPFQAGSNGGGAFLILYLVFIAVFGLSVVMAEMTMGRMTRLNPAGAFRKLGGGAWPVVGYIGVFTGFVILSFYIVIAGWTIAYMWFMLSGALATPDAEVLTGTFTGLIGSGANPIVLAAVFMVLTAGVVIGGIGGGIERASKVLMPLLFLLLIAMVVRSVTLDGAGEGIRFFLVPDWSKVTGATVTAALGQAFFSLSLGMGALITYGSYLNKQISIPGSAAIVVSLDTSVAVLAGFMVLPAVFAYGLNPGEGPGLSFITLPAVFAEMPAGAVFGFVFFALLFVAALTSAVSLLEVVVTYLVDETPLGRKGATLVAAVVCFLLGIPSSLSQGAAEITVFGMSFLDAMVWLAFNLLLPLGGMLTALFVGWKLARRAVEAAAPEGAGGFALGGAWLFVLRFIAPIGIAWVLIKGLGIL